MSCNCETNIKMSSNGGIRWFVRVSQWIPTRDEWLLGLRCIQNEEQIRINRFVFKNDAKLALIGRLLLRKSAQLGLDSVNYNEIRFDRTERGRPIVTNAVNAGHAFDANISHSGDYCVCASINGPKIGVDVMKIENSGGLKRLPEFFRLMNRQFSQTEWHFINSGLNDWQKLSRFIRLWSLKESFVKAEGIGIAYDLKRISFNCLTPYLKVGEITRDSVIAIDDKVLNEWMFEETLLDDNHCVSVASLRDKDVSNNYFKELTLNDLLKDAIPLCPDSDQSLWNDFTSKADKPNIK